jgi:hypothetical protein
MKIIVKTSEGAHIVEVTMENMITLSAAALALAGIAIEIKPEPAEPACPVPLAEARPVPPKKVGRRPHAAPLAPHSSLSVGGSEKSSRHKICAVCGKGFLDKSPSNKRKICTKIACKKAWKKRANDTYRNKRLGKPVKEIACMQSSVNPADPGLTDQQREDLKAKRLATLKALADKHKYDNAD